MLRIFVLLCLLAGCTTEQVERMISQSELESTLASAGISPRDLGMEVFRICEARAVSANGFVRSTGRTPSSSRDYSRLVDQTKDWNQDNPDGNWSTSCSAEWQLATPSLIRRVGADTILQPVTVTVGDKTYTYQSRQHLIRYHNCEWIPIAETGMVFRHPDCAE